MEIRTLDRIHTIFSLLLIPLIALLFYLNHIINLPMPVIIFSLIIYGGIIGIIGTYTLPITQGKKNAIAIFDAFSVVVFICFYALNLIFDWTSLLATQVYVTFLDIWIILSGIVGLLTNTVIVSRGKPYVYENGSILGRVFNWLIIFMGLTLLVFLFKDDILSLWYVG